MGPSPWNPLYGTHHNRTEHLLSHVPLHLQSIMFYIPKYLWKAKEGKRLRQLINELRNKHITEISEYDRRRIVQDVVDSLLISKDYFYFFFFCEFLYFINLIAQIWFTVSLLMRLLMRLSCSNA